MYFGIMDVNTLCNISYHFAANALHPKIIDYAPNNGYKSIFQMIRRFSRKSISLPINPMRRGFTEDCYVIPSFRKKGIGSQLVISAMKWFQSKQISRIQLSLVARNIESEAFWRKSGFDTFRLTLSRDI